MTWQNIYKKYPFPFSWLERYNLKNADYAIAGNESISNILVRKGFDKERISLIPLGTDTLLFRKMDSTELRSRLRLEVFTIGYLGRLVEEKGILDLLNCMDCIVLPSRTTKKWKEQFGRVLTEAMSCEVPVVGSDCGEIPNVLGDCGLIFKEGCVDDLSSKIKLLLNNKDLRMELSKKGRQRVLDNFTQEIVARETYKIYQKMIYRKKAQKTQINNSERSSGNISIV